MKSLNYMKIKAIQTTPLLVPYAQPYYWSQGVTRGAEVLLIDIHSEANIAKAVQ